MKIEELIVDLKTVLKNKAIEIKNKKTKEDMDGDITYSTSFEHGVDSGYMLLATDVLKLLGIGLGDDATQDEE